MERLAHYVEDFDNWDAYSDPDPPSPEADARADWEEEHPFAWDSDVERAEWLASRGLF